MTVRAYIGLGSNLDDPVSQVLEAVDEIEMLPDTILVDRSSLYRGNPMGPQDQPDYVNAVAAIDTLLSPQELLEGLQSIETLQGRERSEEQWAPRIIDLDLLLYGSKTISSDTLTVPHPGMHERDFVLVPLEEIAGNVRIPGQGQIYSLINSCQNHSLKKLVTA